MVEAGRISDKVRRIRLWPFSSTRRRLPGVCDPFACWGPCNRVEKGYPHPKGLSASVLAFV